MNHLACPCAHCDYRDADTEAFVAHMWTAHGLQYAVANMRCLCGWTAITGAPSWHTLRPLTGAGPA